MKKAILFLVLFLNSAAVFGQDGPYLFKSFIVWTDAASGELSEKDRLGEGNEFWHGITYVQNFETNPWLTMYLSLVFATAVNAYDPDDAVDHTANGYQLHPIFGTPKFAVVVNLGGYFTVGINTAGQMTNSIDIRKTIGKSSISAQTTLNYFMVPAYHARKGVDHSEFRVFTLSTSYDYIFNPQWSYKLRLAYMLDNSNPGAWENIIRLENRVGLNFGNFSSWVQARYDKKFKNSFSAFNPDPHVFSLQAGISYNFTP